MTRVLALANQKGGVAKTTSTHTLGVALAEQGQRVLLVDLDPQACLTYSNGVDPDSLEHSIHDVLLGRIPATDALVECGRHTLLPSTIDLAGGEVHLLSKTGREYALRKAIEPLRERFDMILVDCPPSLGILTINGLTAAEEVVVPLQCETLSKRGVGQLLDTIAGGTGLRIGTLDATGSTQVPGPGQYAATLEGIAVAIAECLEAG